MLQSGFCEQNSNASWRIFTKGLGYLAWCGHEPSCYKLDKQDGSLNMTRVDYAENYAIVGPAVDQARGALYYIACDRPTCIRRSDSSAQCEETVGAPVPNACGGYRLMRYRWLTGERDSLYSANAHDPGVGLSRTQCRTRKCILGYSARRPRLR